MEFPCWHYCHCCPHPLPHCKNETGSEGLHKSKHTVRERQIQGSAVPLTHGLGSLMLCCWCGKGRGWKQGGMGFSACREAAWCSVCKVLEMVMVRTSLVCTDSWALLLAVCGHYKVPYSPWNLTSSLAKLIITSCFSSVMKIAMYTVHSQFVEVNFILSSNIFLQVLLLFTFEHMKQGRNFYIAWCVIISKWFSGFSTFIS